MKRRSITMYNLIFPVFLIFSPLSLMFLPFAGPLGALVILAFVVFGNLAVDWLVTALAMLWQRIPEVKQKSLSVLGRVYLSGFAADFLSALLLFIIMLAGSDENTWLYENVSWLFSTSIYRSPYALGVTVLAIFIAGWLIYLFNMKWSLRQADLTQKQRRRIALALAVLTAPWLFLLPANWFYA